MSQQVNKLGAMGESGRYLLTHDPLPRNSKKGTRFMIPIAQPLMGKEEKEAIHVFHQYTIRVKEDRDQVVEQLGERGIGTGIYYPLPVHRQPIYQELGYTDRLPVAEAMSREVLSLPVHPALSQADLERIVEVVSQLQSDQGRE